MEPKQTKLKNIRDEKCLTKYKILIKYGREDSVYLHFVFIFYFLSLFLFIYLLSYSLIYSLLFKFL